MAKYSDIEVELTDQDGNGFVIVCRVRAALKHGGVSATECQTFFNQALAGDYDHLLQTVMEWVEVS